MMLETRAQSGSGRRRKLRAALFSLAGGVAIAIGVAALLVWNSTRIQPPWEEQPDRTMQARTPGVMRTLAVVSGEQPDEPRAILTIVAGWPLPAVIKRSSYLAREPLPPGAVPIRPSYMAAEEVTREWWRYRPLWLGLASNAMLFSTALFGAALVARGMLTPRRTQ